MKRIKREMVMVLAFVFLMTNMALANTLTWESAVGHHGGSILLPITETVAKDVFQSVARGEIISSGMTEITNKQNGDIHISIDTYAHCNVDKIFHSVYLDRWDEKTKDWVQVDYWDFEKTKEESGGKLTYLSTGFTLKGYPTNCYYRVRGLHGVELGDEMEGCATETNGVLITKN